MLVCLALQLADVVDNEAMQVYMKPPGHEEAKAASKGFVVRDAPWTAGNTEKVGVVYVVNFSWAGENIGTHLSLSFRFQPL